MALHLPTGLERSRLSRSNGNALHRQQGQRRRYVRAHVFTCRYLLKAKQNFNKLVFSAAYPLLAWSIIRKRKSGSKLVNMYKAEPRVCFRPRIYPCLSDGLVDCLDPDCCLQLSCQNHLYCQGSPDPVKVLSQSPSSLDHQRVRKGQMRIFTLWF